jgi:hypothetical protein
MCGAFGPTWLVVLLTAPSLGAREARPVQARLTYEAPPGCPDRAAFEAKVRRRTPWLREDGASPDSVTLAVTVDAEEHPASGRVEVVSPQGERTSRSLTAASCEELTDALALMTALSIDLLAGASDGLLQAPRERPEAPPSPPPRAEPAASSPPPAPRTPPPGPVPRVAPPPPASPPPDRSRGWRFAAGVGADVSWGVTPEVMFGPRASVEATSPRRGVLGLSLRAAVARAARASMPVSGGEADFTWTIGTLDICPLRWEQGSLTLAPCARLEAGKLDGTGVNVMPVHDAPRGWLAVAALARLRWTFAPPLALEIEGGVRAPFIRDRFIFDPDTLVYQPPPLSALAGAGLVVTFL